MACIVLNVSCKKLMEYIIADYCIISSQLSDIAVKYVSIAIHTMVECVWGGGGGDLFVCIARHIIASLPITPLTLHPVNIHEYFSCLLSFVLFTLFNILVFVMVHPSSMYTEGGE